MVLNVYSWRPDYSTCSVDTAVGYVALRPALLHAYLGPHITSLGWQTGARLSRQERNSERGAGSVLFHS
jgi:hypothetical protein